VDGKVCVEESERLGHNGLLYGPQREVLLRYLVKRTGRRSGRKKRKVKERKV
jgi:hypothetical protein